MTQPTIIEDCNYDALLDDQINSNIADFIVHEACQKYFKTYNKLWVPTSFLEFYFSEYERFDFLSPYYLKPFFEKYNINDMPAIIENYYNSPYSSIKRKSNKQNETYYLIADNYNLHVNLADPLVLGSASPELFKNLYTISKQINSNDELVSIEELYEYYMLKKVVLSTNGISTAAIKAVTPAVKQSTGTNTEQTEPSKLVGTLAEIPNQTGKVVKLFFPKLILPSPYPILINKSRINSDFRSRLFMPTDKQLKLVGKYKFAGIKYNVGFIEKRKAAKVPEKRKFDFDF